jgi:glycosyltransferase involved in cell wall biosynthesis
MSDPLGQSQVIPYLKGLSGMGHEIFLLSCEKRNIDAGDISKLQNELEKSGIHWSYLNYTKRPPVLSTLFDIRKIKKESKRIVLENKIDIVHCRGYITALAGLWLKSKFGLKFVFDMRGFFADERVEGGLWNLKNPIYNWVYNYFKKKEKMFFRDADQIVCLTENGKEIINSWKIKNEPLPVTVIPCCADLDFFDRSNVNEKEKISLMNNLGLTENDFVISYLGSVGTWYMPDEMLDFFKVLSEKRKESKFLFISPDSPETIISSAIRKGISPENIIVRKAKRTEVPLYVSSSQLSIFFIKPVFSKRASSPTKMGEIMGMGVPLICNRNVGDVNKIIDDSKAGYALSEFTREEYITAVNKIDELLEIPPEQIREAAKKYFSLSDGVEKYHHIYTQLSKERFANGKS